VDQVKAEVLGCLDFVSYVYGLLDLDHRIVLASRPAKAIGSLEEWAAAEAALQEALMEFLKKKQAAEGISDEDGEEPDIQIDVGGGAFYGPKLDIMVRDAIGREHQVASVQLDFQLPRRFNLQYAESMKDVDGEFSMEGRVASDPRGEGDVEELQYAESDLLAKGLEEPLKPGFQRPVMIHRAIFGSLERAIAILSEHFDGKWPMFLSPRQIAVLPVSVEKHMKYASYVAKQYQNFGLFAEADLSDRLFKAKVAGARAAAFNYVCVVGGKEEQSLSVAVSSWPAGKEVREVLGLVQSVSKFLRESQPSSQPLNCFDEYEGRKPE
jgi:threonyl-tRNA synthetase